ncbi:MAG: BlaI/MecI/CopY family transcriptional regulator [Acidobacteriota bacterium]
MARKKSPTLTEAELRLMQVLWDKGSATVNDVLEGLPSEAPAYSTVLTTLRILEQKGYIRHLKRGRAFVYYPIVNQGQARKRAIKYLVSRFFNDSPELLVLNILENEEIDRVELDRLRKMIEESE